MSLINDALKKAREAQRNAPPRNSAPELRPVAADQARGAGPSLALFLMVIAVVVIGGLLVWLGMSGRNAEPAAADANQSDSPSIAAAGVPASTVPSSVQPKRTMIPAPTPEMVAAPEPLLVAADASPTTTATAASPAGSASVPLPPATTEPAVVPAVKVEPPPPALPRLQGIFYNPNRPSAVLDNKSVFIGGRIGDFRVLTITQESVTIAGAGQTNVLSLSE